jgi:hypothetical protein
MLSSFSIAGARPSGLFDLNTPALSLCLDQFMQSLLKLTVVLLWLKMLDQSADELLCKFYFLRF